jgi:hypothetical protein
MLLVMTPLVQIDSIPQESSIVVLLVFLVCSGSNISKQNFAPSQKKLTYEVLSFEFNTYVVVLDHPNLS